LKQSAANPAKQTQGEIFHSEKKLILPGFFRVPKKPDKKAVFSNHSFFYPVFLLGSRYSANIEKYLFNFMTFLALYTKIL
jgi:hypothetical protein